MTTKHGSREPVEDEETQAEGLGVRSAKARATQKLGEWIDGEHPRVAKKRKQAEQSAEADSRGSKRTRLQSKSGRSLSTSKVQGSQQPGNTARKSKSRSTHGKLKGSAQTTAISMQSQPVADTILQKYFDELHEDDNLPQSQPLPVHAFLDADRRSDGDQGDDIDVAAPEASSRRTLKSTQDNDQPQLEDDNYDAPYEEDEGEGENAEKDFGDDEGEEEVDDRDADLDGMNDEELKKSLAQERPLVTRRRPSDQSDEEEEEEAAAAAAAPPSLTPMRLLNMHDVNSQIRKAKINQHSQKSRPQQGTASQRPAAVFSVEIPTQKKQRLVHASSQQHPRATGGKGPSQVNSASQVAVQRPPGRRDRAMMSERPEVQPSRRRQYASTSSAASIAETKQVWSPETDLIVNRLGRILVKSQNPIMSIVCDRVNDMFIRALIVYNIYRPAAERPGLYTYILSLVTDELLAECSAEDEPVFQELAERIKADSGYAGALINMGLQRQSSYRSELKKTCADFVRDEYDVSPRKPERICKWMKQSSYIFPGNIEGTVGLNTKKPFSRNIFLFMSKEYAGGKIVPGALLVLVASTIGVALQELLLPGAEDARPDAHLKAGFFEAEYRRVWRSVDRLYRRSPNKFFHMTAKLYLQASQGMVDDDDEDSIIDISGMSGSEGEGAQ
ncbi:hypothetical protein K474DRAFT_1673534 [Panus rudis PR-1116 ss-1]|nr:hypothetical protein K474DRAFT_1673534 [Panus rudis PR-1116 ss-1]